MSKTLKELLKPPYEVIMLYGLYRIRIGENQLVLHPCERISRTKQKKIAKWIAGIINEQWEKEFGEPVRWILQSGYGNSPDIFICPVCDNGDTNDYNFCPHCGQRLDPPKDEDNVCPHCGVPEVEGLTMCACDGEYDCCPDCGNDIDLCECEHEDEEEDKDWDNFRGEPRSKVCGEAISQCDCTL